METSEALPVGKSSSSPVRCDVRSAQNAGVMVSGQIQNIFGRVAHEIADISVSMKRRSQGQLQHLWPSQTLLMKEDFSKIISP